MTATTTTKTIGTEKLTNRARIVRAGTEVRIDRWIDADTCEATARTKGTGIRLTLTADDMTPPLT